MNVIRDKFADDVVVNSNELCEAIRISRFTLLKWKKAGYIFQYGRRTTPGHCKEWLESQSKAESKSIENVLAGLN